MIESVSIGFIAAAVVSIGRFLSSLQLGHLTILFILSLGVILSAFAQWALQRKKIDAQGYQGLPDLFIHIHTAVSSDSSLKWVAYGATSILLRTLGGFVGIEGSAIEMSHAYVVRLRSRTARWFEGKRRTDAAASIAAGFSAAFGTPFSGMLLPIELNTGGNSLVICMSALSAFLFCHFTNRYFFKDPLFGFYEIFHNIRIFGTQWVVIFYVAVASSAVGLIFLWLLRLFQAGFSDLLKKNAVFKILLGGCLLVGILWVGGFSDRTIVNIFQSDLTINEISFLFCIHVFSLILVVSSIGSCGVFYPIFFIGTLFGFGMMKFLGYETYELSLLSGFVGAAGVWGAVLNTPITVAVLGFELTKNLDVLFGCLMAGYLGRGLCQLFKTPHILQMGMQQKGAVIVEGRSVAVLDTIFVRDAMVTDFEMIHEHQPVSEIHAKIAQCKYPFFPVTNTQGHYVGLISIDMVEEARESQAVPASSNSSLTKLLEAKDLLYRSGIKSPTLSPGDKLSRSSGLFQYFPCVPVLDEEGRVAGLLFVHTVRLAYDREIARRSIRG